MLLVSIIDPSKEDVTRLSALIERYFRRSGTAYVQRVYQSGMEFVRSAENSDIVFLETNLEKLDGLETARIIRKLGSEAQLIFVARDAEMAIHGYSVDALDYLLKPVEQAAVERALDKAVRRLSSRSCAELYGLETLASSVQDKGNNRTRFICISKKLEIYPGSDKTSVMMILPHQPGSLYKVLARLYTLGINVTKLESRPIPDRDFEFMFYFDLEASVYSAEFMRMIDSLSDISDDFRYLGSYGEVI